MWDLLKCTTLTFLSSRAEKGVMLLIKGVICFSSLITFSLGVIYHLRSIGSIIQGKSRILLHLCIFTVLLLVAVLATALFYPHNHWFHFMTASWALKWTISPSLVKSFQVTFSSQKNYVSLLIIKFSHRRFPSYHLHWPNKHPYTPGKRRPKVWSEANVY